MKKTQNATPKIRTLILKKNQQKMGSQIKIVVFN